MQGRVSTTVGVTLCALLVFSCTTAPPPGGDVSIAPDVRFSTLRDEFKSMVDAGELSSLAVGVVEDGRIVWAEAFGVADRENGVPATVNTRYGVASLGKSITATAAMRLVEKGRLDLNATVARILGDDYL
jgi:CubicO group peptidase (beta-lactamase class C family)